MCVADLEPVAPIRTERLVLRGPEAQDRAAVIELFASPEVGTYIGGSRPRDELERTVPEVPRRRPGLFVVDLDGAMIGIVTLDRRDADRPGHVRPDAGETELHGKRIERLRPHEIAAQGVARTFQVPKLFGNMTVLENVLVPAFAELDRGDGRPVSSIVRRARDLLQWVTLDPLRHALAKELSGGQSMLLQIARGLMVHPIHLFLMDEPFAGVHPTIKDTIMETILRMNREEAVTFLIVSHEMGTLRRLCSRVTVMHEGRLIAEGPLETVANHPLVLEAYLGG